MNPATLSELLKLSETERIQLAQDLRDSIPADSEALPLSPELLEGDGGALGRAPCGPIIGYPC